MILSFFLAALFILTLISTRVSGTPF